MSAAAPSLVVVAAVARDGAIGRAGGLLWHEAEDQRHFRRETLGSPVVMGRKTWDSLPPHFRPLPGRRNLVLTHDAAWQAAGAEAVHSLDEAFARAGDAPRLCVIGGAEVYALALPRADELVLTEIDAAFTDADTHFPRWPREAFDEVERLPRRSEAGVDYAFVRYQRRQPISTTTGA